MHTDPYKDQMYPVELFGKQVLYTEETIDRADVPEGWYCYDLSGTDRKPDRPVLLTDLAIVFHVGTVLSPQPLKRVTTLERKIKEPVWPCREPVTLAEFCVEQDLPVPQDLRKYIPRPASPEESGLFYTQTPEKDEALGTIGHVRIDFGSSGKEFWHTWWPRGPEALNTQAFRDELDGVVNELRGGILKDFSSMRRYCWGHGGEISGGACCQNYGYVVETERYLYRLRCNPAQGDYHAYLSCFDKQAQQMGMTNAPVIGRITFASGEEMEYTDPKEYLDAVREELPYHPATGFRCETLTDDPGIRKAVDDLLCDLYGEKNPRRTEDYGGTNMTMGGMRFG